MPLGRCLASSRGTNLPAQFMFYGILSVETLVQHGGGTVWDETIQSCLWMMRTKSSKS